MDLPTYTSIWRIEKRLYKLYDFRLPMPLPIGQVTVFAAVAVPYVVILQLIGLPFNHTLIWLYILPPGVVTWLVTRPVLESKRLPELVRSQLRYLAEPKVICRMAPLAEREIVVVTARVWRPRTRRPAVLPSAAEAGLGADEMLDADGLVNGPVVAGPLAAVPVVAVPVVAVPVVAGPVVGSTRVESPVVAGPVAASASVDSTRIDSPVGESTLVESTVVEGSLVESTVVEGMVVEGTVVDGPGIDSGGEPENGPADAPGKEALRPQTTAAASARRPAWPITGWASAASAVSATAAEAASAAEATTAEAAASAGSQVPAVKAPAIKAPAVKAPGSHEPAIKAPAVKAPAVKAVAPEVPAGLAVPARPVVGASADPEAPATRAIAAGPVAPAPTPARGLAGPAPAQASAPSSDVTDAPEAADAAAAEASQPREGAPATSPDAAINSESPASAPPGRPHVIVVNTGAAPAVETALAGPSARRGDRAGRVAMVPGGHRPGRPDLLHRDRARAQRPIGEPARVVVLGCTVGAGQTMTALLTGDVLASLRTDRVAVLDLNPGQGSLASRAEARPALGQAALLTPSRLAIITPPRPGANGPFGGAQNGPRADAELAFAAATDRYDLVIADPATAAVPRLLGLADQLVLVAPASGAAPGAVAMTFEWLDAHGHAGLSARAIMVLNGVSRRSIAHVEQAERVCAGRCRAIVRVPWDDQLEQRPTPRMPSAGSGPQGRPHWAGVLGPAAAGAFTALAGVLVGSLADRADRDVRAGRAGRVPGPPGAEPARERVKAGQAPR